MIDSDHDDVPDDKDGQGDDHNDDDINAKGGWPPCLHCISIVKNPYCVYVGDISGRLGLLRELSRFHICCISKDMKSFIFDTRRPFVSSNSSSYSDVASLYIQQVTF